MSDRPTDDRAAVQASTSALEHRFHRAALATYDQLARFGRGERDDVDTLGGTEVARRLLRRNERSPGFILLWEMGRLDATLEAAVLRPEFATLFSSEEREAARLRLQENGYFAD